ncbi:acetate--CoA ligase family protein [Sciscionella marina]|uniref:acetate--CoA ligase family protein n=1 Tax=Sciscionella marina TaxID=508770 RepID=UPI0009FC4058|nr:acetate--CoA ligase family protein [Sciscionella marina]
MSLRGQALVESLARPGRVAVVGASSNLESPSGRPVDYLVRYGYAEPVYPVNPRNREIAGLPAMASLAEAEPDSVDTVLVAVPAPAVVAALADAERAGARVAVIIGGGFEDRQSPERRALDEFAAGSAMRIIGPNCVGTVGTEHSAFLTFSSVLRTEHPERGSIGLVTQSGALGNSLLQTLMRRHVGLSQWVSTGDEVDVGALEIATGLLNQEGTDTVGLFLEGVGDLEWLPRLEEVLRDGRKRLFVFKAANSSAGRLAAAGHTGRVVGSAEASHAILHEAGAREVPTVSALADALLVAGTCHGVADVSRPRVAIVSVSGAAGVIGSDRVAAHERLTMAEIDAPAATMLESRLDARLAPANPLDVPFLDDTAGFADAISAFAATGVADVILGVESGLAHDRQELVAKLAARTDSASLVLTSLSEDDQIPSHLTEILATEGIAYLPTIERAVDAVAACAPDHGAASFQASGEADVAGIEWAADRLPDEFPWAKWRVVHTLNEVNDTVTAFGLPLVLKAAGRTITHRTELGAVRVVREAAAAGETFAAVRTICARHGDVVLAQQMAPGGFELMVSALRDDEYGPIAVVRPGGVLTEAMTGQAVLWCGWPSERRERVLRESLVGRLLDGYRGGPRYDVPALNELISTALSAVANSMRFLEINPVIVGTEGVHVVDLIARA